MPLNFLERQTEFHNTDEGFRHNKREAGRRRRRRGARGKEVVRVTMREVQTAVSHSANNSLTLDWD